MQVAENSYEFAAKCLVRRGFGAELAPHNPGLQLFPVFRDGPAVVLLPFSFFCAVPITFVASAQALFLLCEPARIGCDASVRNLRQRVLSLAKRMSRLMRDKFAPVRPLVSNCGSNFNTAGASSSHNARSGRTTHCL